MSRVIAVQVREVDPPQFVAEDMDDLVERFPGEWGGEQCDSCGCTAYTVELDPDKTELANRPSAWQVRCSGDAKDADRLVAEGYDAKLTEAVRNGCGATYRLRFLDEDEVQF